MVELLETSAQSGFRSSRNHANIKICFKLEVRLPAGVGAMTSIPGTFPMSKSLDRFQALAICLIFQNCDASNHWSPNFETLKACI